MSNFAYVKWRDATMSQGDEDLFNVDALMELEEIGWLIKETDDSVSLSIEKPQFDKARLWLTIPKVNIMLMQVFDFDVLQAQTYPSTQPKRRKRNV